ncbi:hypothetical protein BHE90_004277 [Fusarium euwallaceae]|uniref:Xylanolytic transcriptional activator regulatory domain-containing protein n=2 Tax=Fusarium solani species complex TaxID=232080 RepID=A0A3M2SK24_9HYPO|nr:hypothetical protein CDV36_002465 [Fusarium kuroshium]RTE81192.1 hypothetical protein BHE90_004277 [Fusarium euwallaceae]
MEVLLTSLPSPTLRRSIAGNTGLVSTVTSAKCDATEYYHVPPVLVPDFNEDRINPPELDEVQESVPGSSSGLSLALGLSPMDLNAGTDPDRLHPDAQLALRLWTVYAERVDPVLKILHIPTAQSAMIAMISGPKQTSYSLEALAFAVYYAAVTSLSENEMSTISVDSRQGFLQKCKLGLNQAITRADFLNEPNMMTLQALAIFAKTCLRVHDNSRAVWVLIGTAIRLAQSIGIHRDGASLKLDPFESELRLRLWWHLCVLDSRAPEDHGFTNTLETLDQGLRLPLNVDDAQLYPAMRSLPCDSENWTEMTFSLVQLEAARLVHRILIAKPRNDVETPENIEAKRAVLEKHNEWIESRFLALPPASNLRNAACAHYYTACAKIEFMLQVRQELHVSRHREAPGAVFRGLGERPFTAACRTLERSWSLASGQVSMEHTWIFKTYTQWYALAYVLRYLCAFPNGPETKEAWALVTRAFSSIPYAQSSQLARESNTGRNSIWKCLESLRCQALNARTTARGSPVLEPSAPNNSQDSPVEDGAPEISAPVVSLQDQFSSSEDASLFAGQAEPPRLSDTTQSADQWYSGLPSFGDFAMPEMLYLPEWNDIVNGS